MRSFLFGIVTLTAATAGLSAQTVVNEVLYDPTGPDSGNEEIELANLGATAQDLTGWSLCLGFSAPTSRTYWNFPAGTSIPAGGFLRVHWMANGQNTATELFTGTNSFTCFQPGRLMDDSEGSVALYSSQSCAGFGFAANIVDFVQWGGGTFRESVAVQAGIWPQGAAVPLVAEGHSLAFVGQGNSPEAWFDDACPTLGIANTAPGSPGTATFGTGCAGSAGTPAIVAVGGPPALGNQSFAIAVQNVPNGAPAALLVGTGKTSVPVLGCTLLVNPIVALSTRTGQPFPLPVSCSRGQIGASLEMQWIVVDPGGPAGLSASEGLTLTL